MARQLNFQQIEAFKAVMQMGTTTAAALMLNTTQPSVSRRIAELQAATELKLFELHHGRLRPTSEGKLLYKTIQKHFAGLEKIESVAAIMRKSGTGVLRLGCTPTLGTGLLPPVIHAFLKKFPNTHINIETLSTPQLADYLHQDLIDLALTTGKLDQKDFEPVVIKKSRAVCVLPPKHRLKTARTIRLRQLKDEQLLSISETDELTIKIKSLLRDNGIPDEFAIQTSSSITVCALVAAGNGVGIVNPYVASTFAGQLLIKELEPAITIPIEMAMPQQTAPSLLARHFVDILLEHVKTI
ncbi:LysR family transcriptional regulator [Noviherbaspirillum massiliense]|uniref:LysR family transcriptional regulator n=1 Tax=Noviherbaspirillum massiliense TaxID=1465823 RepID=UPI00030DE627|nr:LysR substrate-binding domain-containing protein [Noviherbaspirillum massiliense]